MKALSDSLLKLSFFPAVLFTVLYLVRYLTGWHWHISMHG